MPRKGERVTVYKKATDGSVSLTKPLMTPKLRSQVRVACPIVAVLSLAFMVGYVKRRNYTFTGS